ncbi:hypothetical protein A9X62_07295 [Escherichia coli]|nr:hypothetical protein A9X62_07295 [Escherichia coli]
MKKVTHLLAGWIVKAERSIKTSANLEGSGEAVRKCKDILHQNTLPSNTKNGLFVCLDLIVNAVFVERKQTD